MLNHKTGGRGGVVTIIWGAEVFPNVFETERSGTGGQNQIRLYNFGNLTLKMVREVRGIAIFFVLSVILRNFVSLVYWVSF